MREITRLMTEVLGDADNGALRKEVRGRVVELCSRFPIYEKRLVRSQARMG
jgi:glycine/serine hydroxymethyltransferase